MKLFFLLLRRNHCSFWTQSKLKCSCEIAFLLAIMLESSLHLICLRFQSFGKQQFIEWRGTCTFPSGSPLLSSNRDSSGSNCYRKVQKFSSTFELTFTLERILGRCWIGQRGFFICRDFFSWVPRPRAHIPRRPLYHLYGALSVHHHSLQVLVTSDPHQETNAPHLQIKGISDPRNTESPLRSGSPTIL